jgi:glutamate-1-semialdehyde 2,1-aminomutase
MAPKAAATDRYTRSHAAFERARGLMPGGVNSPVRAYKAVGRDPIFVQHGRGAKVTDIDGNEYVDYVGSYGPLILGHAYPDVVHAVTEAAARGSSFGMPTELESRLAELVIEAVPSIDVVRFVNSGTEACMSAIRLARAATNRSMIVKCTGCYHGHSDALLVQAGSGATTLGTPSSPGVPAAVTANTLLVPFNDPEAVRRVFDEYGNQIACMAVEPIAGNMGTVPPAEGYLDGLRAVCDEHGALLLFDEVMCGFRVAYGGAQDLYGVLPDLTCLGKVVGGGLPCAAYGGREKLMRQVSPDGPVYQAGTLSGNPLAMAAGIAMLEHLRDPASKAYAKLADASKALADGLATAARHAGVNVQVARVGSMICPFFSDTLVRNYEQATRCDTDAFAVFFGAMLDRGVVLPPSQYETWFVSTAHDDDCIKATVAAAREAFQAVAASRS